MSEKLEKSKESGAHHQLNLLAGTWAGVARTWFTPEKVEDESPVAGTMKPILGGMYLLHEYKGSFAGKPLEGVAMYGYNLALQKFEMVWVDSFHTGTAFLFSEGERGADGMNVKGKYAYVTPEIEQYWGWRTTIEMTGPDEVIITAYNISPEGEEQKATETIYKRENQPN